MRWFLFGLEVVGVLHCAQGFILDDNENCPATCKCSEIRVYCTAYTLHGWPVALQNADILQRLYLLNNPHLGNIPSGAFDSFQHSLVYLDLYNTGLTQVPNGIKHLQSLRSLVLSNNAIRDRGFQDDAFGNGPMAIYNLDLAETSITKIPFALCSLTNLHTLVLNENHIETISDGQASCIRNVTYLYMEDCGMSGIPSALRFLTKMTELYLMRNTLKSIEHFDLYGLTNLYGLYVGNTFIHYISPEAFQWTPSLQELHLDDNNITELPDALRLLNRSPAIVLSGNPVHCSCDMRWASDWMKNSSGTIAGNCKNHAASIDTYIESFLPRCPS